MAILKIAQMGHPILRQIADPIDPSGINSPEVQHLIGEMYETMLDADGAGLAAPQVYCPVRLVICTLDEGVTVMINPEITLLTDDVCETWEGCLSVKGMRAQVERCAEIQIVYFDQKGEQHERVLEGWNAIVAQHECDHLNGVLYVDRCDTKTLCFDVEYQRFAAHEGEE